MNRLPSDRGNPVVPVSDRVSRALPAGTYYWSASYTGDSENAPSTAACGSDTLTVAPLHFFGPAVSNQSVITLPVGCQVGVRAQGHDHRSCFAACLRRP
jgi:hypothetical protein